MADDNDIDYYQLLCLSPHESNKNKIKESYSALIKIFHPDKQGISEMFQKLTEAHGVLSNPLLKLVYDNFGKEAVDLVKSSDKLNRKANKIFNSISLNSLNSFHIQTYKAYLLRVIRRKINQTNTTRDNIWFTTQTNLVQSINNITSLDIQHYPTKNSLIGFTYDPDTKTQSYFMQYILFFRSLKSESLFIYEKENRKAIKQTIRFKQVFVSSILSYSKNKLLLNNTSFGFNFGFLTFCFNRKDGLLLSGAQALSPNKKLAYSFSLLNPNYTFHVLESHKYYNDTKNISLDNKGISLAHEIFNKNNNLCLSSSLDLAGNSAMCKLSIGIKAGNFSISLPFIISTRLDWFSCLFLSLPYFYSQYIQKKSLKFIYSIYDRISKNNHDAFVEKNREYLAQDYELKIVLALVGKSQSIKALITNANKQSDVNNCYLYGVFDITIALSVLVHKCKRLVIESDIFEIEGVYLPEYKHKDDMWYYIQYTKNNIDNYIFVANNTGKIKIV